MERIEQDRREAQDDEAEELRAEEQAIARAEAEKQQRGKYSSEWSGTRMEHCSYRHSDFYWLFSLLMHCMESQLSNQRPNSVY